MKIIIAGAGEVGSHLAKMLSREEQDITLIDTDTERLAAMDANYNLLTINGNPTSFAVQSEARVDGCDLFIAVTPHETRNVVACAIASSLGAKKTVARVDNYEYKKPDHREFFASVGVNDVIYPEHLASVEIVTALEHNWVRHWFELHDGELIIVGVKIRDNAPIIGMHLKELAIAHHSFHVAAIKRNHETIFPRGDDFIRSNDIVYFATRLEDVNKLVDICGKVYRPIRDVMIMGGSRIAIRLVHSVGDRYNFKIIETDRDLCVKLAEKCPQAEIINADARLWMQGGRNILPDRWNTLGR